MPDPATVQSASQPTPGAAPERSPDIRALHEDVALAGGTFLKGDSFGEGYPDDGEGPVHAVTLDPFRIDATAVTNTQWAAFVEATGYQSESERYGTSAVFHLAVQADPSDVLDPAEGVPWWLSVKGADWANPYGLRSHWQDLPHHPVTQISFNDAQAYCGWAGRRLPTEAEWEFAARGGLQGARYAWGNELLGGGSDGAAVHLCNIWQGTFPTANTTDDGYLATAPVKSLPPNGFGLYEVAGNVWEWCATKGGFGKVGAQRQENLPP